MVSDPRPSPFGGSTFGAGPVGPFVGIMTKVLARMQISSLARPLAATPSTTDPYHPLSEDDALPSSFLTLARRGVVVSLVLAATLLGLDSPASATRFAGAFMADGGGARAMGMGSAFVAVADDASAAFWNPAGLLNAPTRQVIAMHSERFGDLIDRDYVSYVQPLKGSGAWSQGAFAFSVIHLAVDDIPFTANLTSLLDDNGDGIVDETEVLDLLDPVIQDQIQFKTDRELAFMASYARTLGAWQVGGTAKFIRQSVGEFSSFGVGVDLGLLRRDWWRALDVGVKLQDITSTYLSWSTGRNETISPVVTPGASYDWRFPDLGLAVTASGAMEIHFDGRGNRVDQFGYQAWGGFFEDVSSNLFLGVETSLRDRAYLRFGSHGGFDAPNLTFGVGLELSRFRVDYAHAGDVLDIQESTHRVSVGVDF